MSDLVGELPSGKRLQKLWFQSPLYIAGTTHELSIGPTSSSQTVHITGVILYMIIMDFYGVFPALNLINPHEALNLIKPHET